MKDGRLSLTFDQGKIVRSFVGAGLDAIYERIFLKLRRQKNKNDNIDNNVALFLIGCFWLEAIINKTLDSILVYEFQKEGFRSSIWNIIRREKIFNKLKIIVASNKEAHCPELEKNLKDLEGIFKLRNDMVHFHDEDGLKELDATNFEDLKKGFEYVLTQHPDSQLIQELKGEKLNKKIDLIIATKQILDKIRGVETICFKNKGTT